MLVSKMLIVLALFSPLENYGTFQCSHLLLLIVLDTDNHFYKYPKTPFYHSYFSAFYVSECVIRGLFVRKTLRLFA